MLAAPAVWRAHKSGGSCRRCTASCRHPTATPPPCLAPCRALDAYLKRHQKRGLRHIVRRLKEELLVLGVNIVGDWLRDLFNPKLRGRG